MDPTSIRLRTLLGILAAAVVTAAALRHFAHVQAGLSRETIRADALLAAGLIAALIAVEFFKNRLRKSK
jgi:hypothetical protein